MDLLAPGWVRLSPHTDEFFTQDRKWVQENGPLWLLSTLQHPPIGPSEPIGCGAGGCRRSGRRAPHAGLPRGGNRGESGRELPEGAPGRLGGAEWAWTALYRDLAPSCSGTCEAGVPRARDLTGRCSSRLPATFHLQGEEAEFRSWVLAITHHRLIDQRRNQARRPTDPDPTRPSSLGPPREIVEQEALGSLAPSGAAV